MNTFGKTMIGFVLGVTTIIGVECLFSFLNGIGSVANNICDDVDSLFTSNKESIKKTGEDLSSGYRDESSM